MASGILDKYIEDMATGVNTEIANQSRKMLHEADGFISENQGMNEKANVLLIQIFMDELTEFIEKKESE